MSTVNGMHVGEVPQKDLHIYGVSHQMHVADTEEQFSRHSWNPLSSIEGKRLSLGWGGALGDDANRVSTTLDHTATITWGALGLVFATQAVPTTLDRVCRDSLEAPIVQTPAAASPPDKLVWKASTRRQVSSAANFGTAMGFVTAAVADVFTANPTDGIFFIKAENATLLKARVVANAGAGAGAAVDMATFVVDRAGTVAAVNMADNTDIQLGIEVWYGATAAQTFGWWIVNGFKTPMSAAQLVPLWDIFNTTPASLCGHSGYRVNGATQRTGTEAYTWFEVDR